MNTLLSISCAVFLLLCILRFVLSGEDDYDPCKADGFVHGDIAVSWEDLKYIRRSRRAATSLTKRHWKYGIIPYKIDHSFSGDEKSEILAAMRHWENYTCITFVEHSNEKDFIFFIKGSCGCCSFVGRRGNGRQGVSIGNNCVKFGIVVHELGHVVGFWHEHTRPDRNEHVRILNANIKKGEEHNFIRLNKAEVNSYGEPYDFESIMHYAPNTFSKRLDEKTIIPKKTLPQSILPNIGQRKSLSKGDIKQVNKMYQCPKCGEMLLNAFGTLSSPGYPHINQEPRSCVWKISVSSGEVIILTVKDFDMETSWNCETDFMEIRDGHGPPSKLIGRYCGNNKPPTQITSTGNRLWIKLRLNGFSRRKGFFFDYKAVCGGTLKVDKGEIQSPKFPQSYEFNKLCNWRIIVKEGTKVGVQFSSFDIEHDDNCGYDALTIYDGPSVRDPMLKRLCGKAIPDNVISSSNEMVIKFQSDNSVPGKGFALNFCSEVDECLNNNGGCEHICHNTLGSYECACHHGYELHSNGKKCEVACGGELKGRNGTITSPSYPDKYPENKKCVWSIRAPPFHQIKLSFHDFEVEKSGEGCQYDYLEVKSTKNSTRLCGDKLPDVMMSTSNEMDLEFHSDNSMSLKGFSASYCTDKDECQVKNGGCEHDCVNTIGGYLCKCRYGYKLHKDKHRCVEDPGSRSIRESPTGTITSPNYPQRYDSNLDLTWNIIVVPGHRIKLTFQELDIEYNQACGFDYVEVRSGILRSSEVLEKLCGKNVSLQPVISKFNKMQVHFHSDESEEFKGFKAVYDTACGGRLHASASSKFVFSHVNYPEKPYLPNTRCEWHFAAKSGYAIKIKFEKFELEDEEDGSCSFDYVKITDGSDAGARSLGQICGTKSGQEFKSTGNNIWVQFVTDRIKGKKGFYLKYKRVKLTNHSAG